MRSKESWERERCEGGSERREKKRREAMVAMN